MNVSMLKIKVVLVLVVMMTGGETARILAVYPSPSISHQIVFRAINKEIAKQGHEVVVITPLPEFQKGKAPTNLTEIDVSASLNVTDLATIFPKVMTGEKKSVYGIIKRTIKVFADIALKQLVSDQVKKLMTDKTQKFDLILSEAFFLLSMCFSHMYTAPIIFVNSMGSMQKNMELVGSPRHPVLYPEVLQQTVYNHSLIDKANEFQLFHGIHAFSEELSNELHRVIFGEDAPTIKELSVEVDNMLFLNTHYVWEMNRPAAKNVVFLGGLHLKTASPLPKDLQEYLDSSKNGVIYVSFGTSIDAAKFHPERLKLLVNVLSKLPYDVLWKWNYDKLPDAGSNIKISKWLPQADLLRHPQVKLIVFQGGLQSTDEAIDAGVPMLSIPIIADQWYNSQQMVAHRIGVQVELGTVTEIEMTGHIHKLINDETYKRNVIKLRSLLRDQPQTPMSRAIWWMEYVLRHKRSRHLSPPAANMHWTQYFEIELVIYLVTLLIVLLIIVVYLIRKLYSVFVKLIRRWLNRLFLSNKLPYYK